MATATPSAARVASCSPCSRPTTSGTITAHTAVTGATTLIGPIASAL